MGLKWEVEICVSEEKELNDLKPLDILANLHENNRYSHYEIVKATDSHYQLTGKHYNSNELRVKAETHCSSFCYLRFSYSFSVPF